MKGKQQARGKGNETRKGGKGKRKEVISGLQSFFLAPGPQAGVGEPEMTTMSLYPWKGGAHGTRTPDAGPK